MSTLNFTSVPGKRLAATISGSATSFKLSDILNWDKTTDLSSADFGSVAYATFRNSAGTLLEIMEIDPSTITTATSPITINKRGLKFTGDLTTEVAANKLTWVKGDTIVELGSHPGQVFQWLKEYIDDVAVAGAPNASTTTKGIVEEATQAEIDAATAAGGTGARLMVNPSTLATSIYGTRLPSAGEKQALVGNSGTPSSSNTFVTEAGLLTSVLPFGDGSDGDVTISTPTTLTRDMYYNNLVVSSTLTTAGFIIYVRGTISGAGTITGGTASNGGNGSNGATQSGTAAGGSGGTAGAASTTGRLRNTAGVAGATGNNNSDGNGVVGNVGNSQTSSVKTTNGVTGGTGGKGVAGGASSSAASSGGTSTHGVSPEFIPSMSMLGFDMPLNTTIAPYKGNASGGGGGGGGGSDSSGGTNSGGGGGGGSGASGIPVFIIANVWAGTFTISCIGGNGGNGGNGGTATSFGGGSGGGGAGGNGGDAVVFYISKTWTGTATLTGGTGGSPGAAVNGGTSGGSGSNGTAGTLIEVNLTNFS